MGISIAKTRSWLTLSPTKVPGTFDVLEGGTLTVVVGTRTEVKWPDNHTTGHEILKGPGGVIGVEFTHRGVQAFVSLTAPGIQIRLMPPGKPYLKGLKR